MIHLSSVSKARDANSADRQGATDGQTEIGREHRRRARVTGASLNDRAPVGSRVHLDTLGGNGVYAAQRPHVDDDTAFDLSLTERLMPLPPRCDLEPVTTRETHRAHDVFDGSGQ